MSGTSDDSDRPAPSRRWWYAALYVAAVVTGAVGATAFWDLVSR